LAFLFIFLQCRQQPSDKGIVIKSYYDNGKLKDSITLNTDSLKNGKCFYFDDEGDLDSTVTFLNGKRNGLKSKFFGEYGVYTYNYINDTLFEERNYDTLNRLIYIAPLDVNNLPKTTYKLLSNSASVDKIKGDTISLITPGLPSFNRGLNIIGATFRNLKEENTYEIRTTKQIDSSKNVFILVKIYDRWIGEDQIPTRIDTLIIPVK